MEEKLFPDDLKKTKQREDVFEVLVHASEPMTAIDIYHGIVKKEKECSYAISTIYRVLSAFEEKGYVEKSTLMGEDMAVYEWVDGEEHKHYAICLGCHKKVALKKCPFQRMAVISKPSDDEFMITGHKIELYGYCKDCQNKS